MTDDLDATETTADAGKTADRDELRDLLGMATRRRPAVLLAGQMIGDAYRVERELGAGGMGVVYLARDVRLQRDVAIKVHAAVDDAGRLMREAAALAQLVHPNVVTVHEVGTWSEHPYVVMEYVPGGTARSWLAKPRSVREIVRLYLAAGRGLAAAHAAGLVHRDFKPDNVLVGDDGRIRVADFGLARALGDAESGAGAGALGDVTATGTVMGTPAYMAPEQREPGKVGPAADQYAFAVALWEALEGARPGSPPATPVRMPRAIARALGRALAVDPAARWPSMTPLIDELARAVAPSRAPLAIVGGLAVVAVAGGGWMLATRGGGAPPPPPAPAPCAGVSDALADVWNPTRRDAIGAAFAALAVPDAAATFDRAAARLDAYAAAWITQRVDACEATQVRGEQSAQLLDLRDHCLDQRREALDALAGILEHPDATIVRNADAATVGLADLDACRDVPSLDAAPPLPADPAARLAISAVEADVARAQAMITTGHLTDLLAVAHGAVDRADQLADPDLAAEALHTLAIAQSHTGDNVGARATLERATGQAAAAHDDALTAKLWVATLELAATQDEDLGAADRMLPFAQAAVVRAGSTPFLDAELSSAIGTLRQRQGRLPEARDALQHSIAVEEKLWGADDPRLATELNRLGNTLSDLRDDDGARAAYERARASIERAYGPEHPQLAQLGNNLATVLYVMHDYDGAIAMVQKSLAIYQHVYGDDAPETAPALANLAIDMVQIDRAKEALPYADRAVAVVTKAYGPDHAKTARALSMRAVVLSALMQLDGARADLERVVAIQEKLLGADNPELADNLRDLGSVETAQGDFADAHRTLDRAAKIVHGTGGAEGETAAQIAAAQRTLRAAEAKRHR